MTARSGRPARRRSVRFLRVRMPRSGRAATRPLGVQDLADRCVAHDSRRLPHRLRRPAVAVHQPDRQGGSRASPARPLRHDVAGGNPSAASRRGRGGHRAPLPVGAQRTAAARPGRARRLGLPVRLQPGLGEAAQGRRPGRAGRRVLLPQRDRADPVRGARVDAHAAAGAPAGEPDREPQARALPQAGRGLPADRGLLPRPLPGAFRPLPAVGLDVVGIRVRSGRHTEGQAVPRPTGDPCGCGIAQGGC